MFTQPKHQRGIILLVVLGMLSLFSVLIASYVVFSNQVAGITEVQVDNSLPINASLDAAITQLIVGTDDPQSAAFHNSLLEDLYGTDGLLLRVGHRRAGATGGTSMPLNIGTGIDARGLRILSNRTFFKFPTCLADWHNDGTIGASWEPIDTDTPPGRYPLDIDDALTGRFITFVDGPLTNQTLQVIRYFAGGNSISDVESQLAGNAVVELWTASPPTVSIDGVLEPLDTVATTKPNRLLYSLGDDNAPGIASVDDNGDSLMDNDLEAGWPGSDDIGYRFVLNGSPFNGLGRNPVGASGITRTSGSSVGRDLGADYELQNNPRLIPEDVDISPAATLLQHDEPWDAPDFENWFLAWQPSDHRAANHLIPGYSAEQNAVLGSNLIPSFHRPSVINYLMNAPIPKIDEAPSPALTRTFWDIDGTDPDDDERLFALVTRLRRATLRPLPFPHDYFAPIGNEDLDGDGLSADGHPTFTGSNAATNIAFDASLTFANYKTRVLQLARWLANGPWDIDNDGDGLPDSVWIDLKLPVHTTVDFRTIRPMVAVLLEDLDGRVNFNHAGNYQHLSRTFFPTSPSTTTPAGDDSLYISALGGLGIFGRGNGVGPAELNYTHLFDRSTSSGAFGPFAHNQLNTGITNSNLWVSRRYGNLLNRRYDGTIFNYNSNPTTLATNYVKFPGAGDAATPVPSGTNPDHFALVHSPARYRDTTPVARQGMQAIDSTLGTPMDMSGISMKRADTMGNITFDNINGNAMVTGFNDVHNQPYENGLPGDNLYGADDFVGLVDTLGDPGDLESLMSDELLRNSALKSQLTTESRTIDAPEIPGQKSIVEFFARKYTTAGGTAADLQLHLDRMLAPECRKGGRLNLNRGLGNGQDDAAIATNVTGVADETQETINSTGAIVTQQASEDAYPTMMGFTTPTSGVLANYQPIVSRDIPAVSEDFDGTDVNGDTHLDQPANGQELLARHLFCLMYFMVAEPTGTERFPNFPFPDGFTTTNTDVRNRYAAKRIAQWAVNVVDFRDPNATCTRLRYDPNPLDGFDLSQAVTNVVWGMERPELEISETFAFHDKRLRRNLEKEGGGGSTADGEDSNDTGGSPSDSDMDQFRIPQAGAFVEIRSLRAPIVDAIPGGAAGETQPSLPPELYTGAQLDLGRTVGTGAQLSPIWRLAVGEPVLGDANKSIRWLYDAERLAEEHASSATLRRQVEYLTATPDWSDATAVAGLLSSFREVVVPSAEVRTVLDPTLPGEALELSDDDLNPGNVSPSRVSLTRFVWFSSTVPSSTLNVTSNARSGMRPANVFFNPPDPVDAADATLATNASPLLSPGQFALVAPAVETIFGQTSAAVAPNFLYSPSPQRFIFRNQNSPPAVTGGFRFDYEDLTAGSVRTPRYPEDGDTSGAFAVDYHVKSVVPIIAQSLTPDQLSAEPTAPTVPMLGFRTWAAYRTAVPDIEEVRIGFNISAPLSGANYYLAPTYRINTGTTPYPLVDGYRDYANAIGDHLDVPLDHVATAPLDQNGWSAVGTHQEAVGIFLQRLADPTQPWNAIDNPYLTMDMAPMDLTTMNGESDAGEQIDRDGTGALVAADDKSVYDTGTSEFTPPVLFDTRRKIPDTARDRAATALTTVLPPSNSLSGNRRLPVTQRPGLTASFSVLQSPAAIAAAPSVWKYPLGAMWNVGHSADDAGVDSEFRLPTAAGRKYHPRIDVDPYRQTLGFINREYGRPRGANDVNGTAGADTPDIDEANRGVPRGTFFTMPFWNDRDFASPMELLRVPAASATGMLDQFTPGTDLDPTTNQETFGEFAHLLGFESAFGTEQTAGSGTVTLNRGPLPLSTPDVLTGERTPLELIFDVVTTGSPNIEDIRWFEADQVKYIAAPTSNSDRMFNRVVEFLQPPFNTMPATRISGRINLNTTPDYVRKAASFSGSASEFLDFQESVAVGGGNVNTHGDMPNQRELSASYTAGSLFGNGSVYRAFSWANSTFYDLDNTRTRPTVLGAVNAYEQAVDTPFGLGFKAFIESRRGYDDTSAQSGTNSLLNPNLSALYPTQFAGMFANAAAARDVPSVQRFMAVKRNGALEGSRRRTQDMTIFRPHPDADTRLTAPATTLNVEIDPPYGAVPTLSPLASGVTGLQMMPTRHGLFERSLPELHQHFRHQARSDATRFESTSRAANLTTHHSNVFIARLTVGFFEVDSTTGELRGEYQDPETLSFVRGRATFVIDRSVPVGFLPGQEINYSQTILVNEKAQ